MNPEALKEINQSRATIADAVKRLDKNTEGNPLNSFGWIADHLRDYADATSFSDRLIQHFQTINSGLDALMVKTELLNQILVDYVEEQTGINQ